ncbi:MAG: DUF2277 domain-containing protein [Caldilineaceae bacterium]
MCRNIRPLFNFDPPATDAEIRDAALQYVRKISGYSKPSQANQAAFDRAVDEIAAATRSLLDGLVTNAAPRATVKWRRPRPSALSAAVWSQRLTLPRRTVPLRHASPLDPPSAFDPLDEVLLREEEDQQDGQNAHHHAPPSSRSLAAVLVLEEAQPHGQGEPVSSWT